MILGADAQRVISIKAFMLNSLNAGLGSFRRRPAVGGWLLLSFVLYSGHASSSAVGAPLGIAELTQSTLTHHPAIRGALAKVEAAQSDVAAAKWQYWPEPSIGFERFQSGQDQGAVGDKTIGFFRLQQPLWTGGRLSAGLQKAQSNALLTDAESLEVRQALAVRVIQAWSEVVVALRKLESQAQSLVRHQRLLEMVERRLAEGASAQSDAALARSRIELLLAEVELLQAQRDSALDKLRLLTGQRLQATDLVLAHEAGAVARGALADLVDQARSMSPKLQKTIHATEVARANVGLAKSSLLPEVALRYEYQNGNFSAANAPNTNRVFVTLNSSLGAGLSGLSGVNAAVAQLTAAQEQIAEQEQALAEQVQLDFTLVQAARARMRGLAMATQASSEVLDSYERQFLAGRKQWLDLMNAAREQAQSESQLADAMGALELSSLRLVLWTGGVDALLQVRPASTNNKGGVQ
jgi:adhesin transport system outer membrane protein